MHPISIAIVGVVCCYLVPCIMAVEETSAPAESIAIYRPSSFVDSAIGAEHQGYTGATLNRQKRTLFLKKKLIGAGLLGFGLGVAKGYKAGYYSGPQVHHVYLSPPSPSVKYVEYVEKPIFVERTAERPFAKPILAEYRDSAPYGAW